MPSQPEKRAAAISPDFLSRMIFKLWQTLRSVKAQNPEGLDLAWAVEANRVYRWANETAEELRQANRAGAFHPTADDIEAMGLSLKRLAELSDALNRFIAELTKDPEYGPRVIGQGTSGQRLSPKIIDQMKPGAPAVETVVLFVMRQRASTKALITPLAPVEGNKPYKPVKPTKSRKGKRGGNKRIWWEEPAPLPRPKSKLELEREWQATLEQRVYEAEYRAAFRNGDPQPRSQFRRFRN